MPREQARLLNHALKRDLHFSDDGLALLLQIKGEPTGLEDGAQVTSAESLAGSISDDDSLDSEDEYWDSDTPSEAEQGLAFWYTQVRGEAQCCLGLTDGRLPSAEPLICLSLRLQEVLEGNDLTSNLQGMYRLIVRSPSGFQFSLSKLEVALLKLSKIFRYRSLSRADNDLSGITSLVQCPSLPASF